MIPSTGTGRGCTTETGTQADIVFYAMGGGMGHMARAASIAREIGAAAPGNAEGRRPPSRNKHHTRASIIGAETFSRFFSGFGVPIHAIPLETEPSELRTNILNTLNDLRPKMLVVDALPMGLMGELEDFLPLFDGAKMLVARLLNKDYRVNKGVDEFVRENYDAVIQVEKLPKDCLLHARSRAVRPVLARSPSELPGRREARRMLGAGRGQITVMAVGTGPPAETDAFFELVNNAFCRVENGHAILRFASPYGTPSPSGKHTCYYPLMELLPGVDMAVGHAGYHLFHECVATGTPALLYPRPRLYDDQAARAAGAPPGFIALFNNEKQLEKGLAYAVNGRREKKPPRKRSPSGAVKAAEIIMGLCAVIK